MGELLGRLGFESVEQDVVLYARPPPALDNNALVGLMGPTRAWWTLGSWGLRNVWVLDGGWTAWCAEGLEVAQETLELEPKPFESDQLIDHGAVFKASSDDVLAAIPSDTLIIDALSSWPNTAASYGKELGPERMGHITSAVSAPCGQLVDADGKFLSVPELQNFFGTCEVALDAPVIVYCGGGISATLTIFAMELAKTPACQRGSVRLYDDSLTGWVAELDKPMEAFQKPKL
eukprot:TRINITY_DN18596_c0_g1_i3.p1 TRINITY_DN18596_c0_g1~~TRINITY_DN18596_c0_g1_i3.p1  ORF type:complete len:233 (+),score=32.55 TRINITY_DN18596_c0_g1_i3:392-1090(+)